MNLRNKAIAFLGDSITEGCCVQDTARNRYDNVLKQMYGLRAVYNYGVSGTRLAHQTKPSGCPRFDLCFCGRAYQIDPSADIIVVYGGVNDYLHGDAPIGTPEDTTPATFWGAVDFLMALLTSRYAGKTVVFLTPAHVCTQYTHDAVPSPDRAASPDAFPLRCYADILEKKAAQYRLPILNLMDKLGIDANNKADREQFTADGLHFNDAGHHVLAKCVGEFLESL